MSYKKPTKPKKTRGAFKNVLTPSEQTAYISAYLITAMLGDPEEIDSQKQDSKEVLDYDAKPIDKLFGRKKKNEKDLRVKVTREIFTTQKIDLNTFRAFIAISTPQTYAALKENDPDLDLLDTMSEKSLSIEQTFNQLNKIIAFNKSGQGLKKIREYLEICEDFVFKVITAKYEELNDGRVIKKFIKRSGQLCSVTVQREEIYNPNAPKQHMQSKEIVTIDYDKTINEGLGSHFIGFPANILAIIPAATRTYKANSKLILFLYFHIKQRLRYNRKTKTDTITSLIDTIIEKCGTDRNKENRRRRETIKEIKNAFRFYTKEFKLVKNVLFYPPDNPIKVTYRKGANADENDPDFDPKKISV